eukprot:TRINITY_DN16878_c1_g1_i1.p1 TRINITY_DN16878_c1_g1~~TRINITY_DN16878_c1_g1_i1.p1  ORF type:complete len:513 (+),score=89.54 TRINITY_DN16878_c1_g1_i1:59-1540(+)
MRPRQRQRRRRRRRFLATAVCCAGLRPAVAAASPETPSAAGCADRDADLVKAHHIDCSSAILLQLCRNNDAQRRCEDDDQGLRVVTDANFSCHRAARLGGCADHPAVGELCPRACGYCPITPLRAAMVDLVRSLCPRTCGLCPGMGAEDCIGSFGAWTACDHGGGPCRRSRLFRVTRPAARGGQACLHEDGEKEVADCCGVGTRWRVRAAGPVVSSWEVWRAAFYEEDSGSSSSSDPGCAGPPLRLDLAQPLRPGEDHGTVQSASALGGDPGRPSRTSCIDCCSRDSVGPIASGSQPGPYGCERALLFPADAPPPRLAGAASASWRSQCSPCRTSEAWLGFRTQGEPRAVACVELWQRPLSAEPADGAAAPAHRPSHLQLERWTGAAWEAVGAAMPNARPNGHAVLRLGQEESLVEEAEDSFLFAAVLAPLSAMVVVGTVYLFTRSWRRACDPADLPPRRRKPGQAPGLMDIDGGGSDDAEYASESETSRLLG